MRNSINFWLCLIWFLAIFAISNAAVRLPSKVESSKSLKNRCYQFLSKTTSFFFQCFFQINLMAPMETIPDLHASMPHVEKLADFRMVILPIFSLTSLGTIRGGLASSAVQQLEIRRCSGSTVSAAPEHDIIQCTVVDADKSRTYRKAKRGISFRATFTRVCA
jgi:hypothetical protein